MSSAIWQLIEVLPCIVLALLDIPQFALVIVIISGLMGFVNEPV